MLNGSRVNVAPMRIERCVAKAPHGRPSHSTRAYRPLEKQLDGNPQPIRPRIT
ncbi:hypothetical protein Pla86_34760 [Planctomycetes bacterium Pla86]|uniref:Uncharacterized protein n=1 Tax=Engelhardtia mirabilis TaxID=2528011 RepID=A0A518BN22_9BACT|nr:hypothetical protein Pla133_34780 [Planctomycetes bacterium Pla133]QDV02707.1 hypothetical protein Pla86_34760 [Planctomycetes bacterium Pla86]